MVYFALLSMFIVIFDHHANGSNITLNEVFAIEKELFGATDWVESEDGLGAVYDCNFNADVGRNYPFTWVYETFMGLPKLGFAQRSVWNEMKWLDDVLGLKIWLEIDTYIKKALEVARKFTLW